MTQRKDHLEIAGSMHQVSEKRHHWLAIVPNSKAETFQYAFRKVFALIGKQFLQQSTTQTMSQKSQPKSHSLFKDCKNQWEWIRTTSVTWSWNWLNPSARVWKSYSNSITRLWLKRKLVSFAIGWNKVLNKFTNQTSSWSKMTVSSRQVSGKLLLIVDFSFFLIWLKNEWSIKRTCNKIPKWREKRKLMSIETK